MNRYYSSTAQATTLVGAASNSATTITVVGTTGFPVSYPYTLIIDRDTASEEVVKVTAAAGDTLTVERGQDGTAAVAHSAGATVEHGVSAQDFREPQEHIADTSTHGVTGDIVGTTDTQTLTNKTLVDAELSGTTTGLSAAGAILDAASEIDGVTGAEIADLYAAWTSYTPTLTNVTGGTAVGAYKLVGKTLFFRAMVTAGTITASSSMAFTIPSGLTNVSEDQPVAGCNFNGSALGFVANGGLATVTSQGSITAGQSAVGMAITGVIEVA